MNFFTKAQKLFHKAELSHFKENISFSSVLDMYETWFNGRLVHAVNTVHIFVKTLNEKAGSLILSKPFLQQCYEVVSLCHYEFWHLLYLCQDECWMLVGHHLCASSHISLYHWTLHQHQWLQPAEQQSLKADFPGQKHVPDNTGTNRREEKKERIILKRKIKSFPCHLI